MKKAWRIVAGIPLLADFIRSMNLIFWNLRRRPLPPPGLFKRKVLKQYAQRYGLKIFIETGTFYGDTIQALKGNFREIYSIELDEALHRQAQSRFSNFKEITLILGDSGDELPKLLSQISNPSLIWLDAHYSGKGTAKGIEEVPVLKEVVAAVRSGNAHAIMVDDMHMFGNDPEYPLLEEVIEVIRRNAGDRYSVEIRDNIMRITPNLSR